MRPLLRLEQGPTYLLPTLAAQMPFLARKLLQWSPDLNSVSHTDPDSQGSSVHWSELLTVRKRTLAQLCPGESLLGRCVGANCERSPSALMQEQSIGGGSEL